jgi:hypothetical protein
MSYWILTVSRQKEVYNFGGEAGSPIEILSFLHKEQGFVCTLLNFKQVTQYEWELLQEIWPQNLFYHEIPDASLDRWGDDDGNEEERFQEEDL